MTDVFKTMAIIFADTYALYLKTQNFHWHVRGPQFKSLHELFDQQYHELAMAIDEIAERIVTQGHIVPASFKDLEGIKKIKDGDPHLSANQMVTDLAKDHDVLVGDLNKALVIAQANNDEGTVNLLSDRITAHEKYRWMLNASREVR